MLRYLQEASDSSLDDFDIPGRQPKKKTKNNFSSDKKLVYEKTTAPKPSTSGKGKGVGKKSCLKKTPTASTSASTSGVTCVADKASTKNETKSLCDYGILEAPKSPERCGMGSGCPTENKKPKNQNNVRFFDDFDEDTPLARLSPPGCSDGKGKMKGKSKGKGKGKNSKNDNFKQLDGTYDTPPPSSPESLATTEPLTDASEDLLADQNWSPPSHTPTDASSNAQADSFVAMTMREVEDQIFRHVPIAEGWPTMEQALSVNEEVEFAEPVARPDLNNPDAVVVDDENVSTSEFENSSFDDSEEVNSLHY